MATIQQLEEGIRRADAAGDSDGVRVLGQQLMAMRQQPALAPRKTSGAAYAPIAFANGITANFLDRAAAAIGTVLPDMGPNHASIWEGKSFKDAYNLNRQQIEGYHEDQRAQHPIANLAEIPGAAAVTAATGGTGLLADMGYGALYGAGRSKNLTKPADVAKNVAAQAALATAGNLGTKYALKAGGKVFQGLKRTPTAQALVNSKVPVTIGQAFGGAAKTFEDRLGGMPIAGDAIRDFRRRQFMNVLKSASDEALAPIGQTTPPAATGRELFAGTKDLADTAYSNALSKISAPVDMPLINGLGQVNQRSMTQPQREAFDSIMHEEIIPRIQQGHLTGEDVQAMKEILDTEIGSYKNAPGYRGVVKPLQDLRGHLMDFVNRNAPNGGTEYANARASYGMTKTLQKAVESSTSDGIPTPRQIGIAIRQSARKYGANDAYARGIAPMQKLADNAAQVLPSAVPDPGTAGQLGFLNLLRHPIKNAPGFATGMALSVPYSRAGNAALQAALFSRPDFIRRFGQLANNPQVAIPLSMLGSSTLVTQNGR